MQKITVGYIRPDIQIHGVRLYNYNNDLVTDSEVCYDRTAWPLYAEYRRTSERYCAHNGSWLCDPTIGDLRDRLQRILNRLTKRTDDYEALIPFGNSLKALRAHCPYYGVAMEYHCSNWNQRAGNRSESRQNYTQISTKSLEVYCTLLRSTSSLGKKKLSASARRQTSNQKNLKLSHRTPRGPQKLRTQHHRQGCQSRCNWYTARCANRKLSFHVHFGEV